MINNLNTVPNFYKMAEQIDSNDSESVLTIPVDLLNKPKEEDNKNKKVVIAR